MKIDIDPDALTFGDMEDFESYTGKPLLDTFSKVAASGVGDLGAKELVALIWVCGRAADPSFTIEDARNAKISEIDVGTADVPDPTPAAG